MDAIRSSHQLKLTVDGLVLQAYPRGPQVMKLCEVGRQQVYLFQVECNQATSWVPTGAILPDGVDTVFLRKTAQLNLIESPSMAR